MRGDLLSRAASKAATAVEDDVTFYSFVSTQAAGHEFSTYDSRNSKFMISGILEKLYYGYKLAINSSWENSRGALLSRHRYRR